jgi:hypothetical protein
MDRRERLENFKIDVCLGLMLAGVNTLIVVALFVVFS